MCGVAGVFHYAQEDRSVDRDELLRMTRTLRHRGPDGEGLYVDGPIGLGHRRLAIVDLSPSGRQPMLAPDGCAIAYNGEAYNHAQFRGRLEGRGVRFAGTSDTETLLHVMREYGPGALADVAGIFAVAFWDARHRRLVLARDPLGVKQLYYHDDGKRIVFASEIKALLGARGVPRSVRPAGVNEYVHFHTPLFDNTLFEGIQQVRAGEYLEVNRHGVRARTYWRTESNVDAGARPESRVAELKQLIARVVREQLMSDVPVGAFFSGGIDSTAVAAFARDTVPRLRCFGVHFSDQGVVDERPYQETAAKALGVDLDLITLDGRSFPDDLARFMYFQDQPVVGPALIPMYYVSGLAARHVKVCLGGQGADEIFGGYARHALVQPWRVLRSWFVGREKTPPQARTEARVGGNLQKQLLDVRNVRRLLARAPHAGDWRRRYFDHFAKVPVERWLRVLPESGFVSRTAAFDMFRAEVDASPAHEPLDRVFRWEVRTYLTALFQQDDRMSMAHGLESRVPLADPRLVRFALETPMQLKLRSGATKWVLRRAVADRIPATVLNRRKVGFDTPAERWMRGVHRDFVFDLLLSTRARQRGFYGAAAVEDLLSNPDGAYWFDVVWKLTCLETWARIFIDGETPVVSTRGADVEAA